MQRSSPSSRGLALVELLVALAVLVFGVYAIYEHYVDLRRAERFRLNQAQGRLLAQQQLEQLRAAGFAALQAWHPPAEPRAMAGFEEFYWRADVQPINASLLEVGVQTGWGPSAEERFSSPTQIRLRGWVAP